MRRQGESKTGTYDFIFELRCQLQKGTLFLPLRWQCRPVVLLLSFVIHLAVYRFHQFSWFSTFFSALLFVKINALLFSTVQKVQKCNRKCLLRFLLCLAYRYYSIENMEGSSLVYLWWIFAQTEMWWWCYYNYI